MIKIILFSFLIYSISNIITQSKIFEKIRMIMGWISPNFLGEMFECMMCMGFWVGVVTSIFMPISYAYIEYSSVFISHFFDGCIGSGAAWVIHAIVNYYVLNNEIMEINISVSEENNQENHVLSET